jgi:hypothetical protein
VVRAERRRTTWSNPTINAGYTRRYSASPSYGNGTSRCSSFG